MLIGNAAVVVAVVAQCVCVYICVFSQTFRIRTTVCKIQFSPNSCVITTHILRMIIRRKLASRR